VSFGPKHELQCLDQETLRELWRVELPNESGGYHALEQDGENVYILAQGRALAFNVSSGKRLWATNEFRSFGVFKIFDRGVLSRSNHALLEWRDRTSGEVIALWGTREGGYVQNVLLVGQSLLVETRRITDQTESLRL
jgi:hypothetical protein